MTYGSLDVPFLRTQYIVFVKHGHSSIAMIQDVIKCITKKNMRRRLGIKTN